MKTRSYSWIWNEGARPTTLFLGLQVCQKKDHIFLNQGKYTHDILTRFGMMENKPLATQMETNLHKLKEEVAQI